MDTNWKRPRRPHLPTWVIIAVVLGAFVYRQFEKRLVLGIGNLGVFSDWSSFGWPVAHLELVTTLVLPNAPTHTYEWFAWRLAGNCLFGVLLVSSTAVVCERWLRSSRRLTISLRQFFAMIAVISVLITCSRQWEMPYRDWDPKFFQVSWSLIGWSDVVQPWRWPLLIGLACTIYVLGYLCRWLCRLSYCFVFNGKRDSA
jgi:hypothetical protein